MNDATEAPKRKGTTKGRRSVAGVWCVMDDEGAVVSIHAEELAARRIGGLDVLEVRWDESVVEAAERAQP